MPEPLAERLSRFTPDGSSLDRDGLLFAAGRASVRPRRRWQALAGALAASQLLTLLFLWPRSPSTTPAVAPHPLVAVEPGGPSTPSDLSAWRLLRDRALAMEGDLPAPIAEDSLVPDDPPLHAFAAPPASLLN